MIVAERLLLTKEGWDQLSDELHLCQQELASRLATYKDTIRGSEPGDAAIRHEQQQLAAARSRMAYLEDILSRAVPVSSTDRTPCVVGVGSYVTVQWEDGEEETYLLVGPPEVDLATNRISYQSPVGASLIGKRQDDSVAVDAPAGTTRMKIVAVR